MFDEVTMAAPDAILGLTEAFKKDPNSQKINLGAGVYKDQNGRTPVLASVKVAEQRILDHEDTKTYISPNSGTAEYAGCVQQILFGADHPIVSSRRAVSVHAPGGTGALRLAGDYLKSNHSSTTLWLSDPTWANHGGVFEAAGLKIKTFPYFDASTNSLAFDRMIKGFAQIAPGDVVLLHACCHNPTGVDPTIEQWQQMAGQLAKQGVVPLIDFAYQGFGDGLEQDATGMRTLCDHLPELLICSSFSKNFALYNERVGALTVVAGSSAAAEAVLSRLKVCVRRNYSTPPAHGSSIVTTVLQDRELRRQWESELKQMRDRINGMRTLFADSLSARGVVLGSDGENGFIIRQRGMFSFSGLGKEQVQVLRERYSIYIVGGGRINVAGMTVQNMDNLCDAIAAVVREDG